VGEDKNGTTNAGVAAQGQKDFEKRNGRKQPDQRFGKNNQGQDPKAKLAQENVTFVPSQKGGYNKGKNDDKFRC